jgi:hypothetical protein
MHERRIQTGDFTACVMVERQSKTVAGQCLVERGVALCEGHRRRIELQSSMEILEPRAT